MTRQQKTGTSLRKGWFWKLTNLTAYPGIWGIGRQFSTGKKIRSVALYPIPFTNRKWWVKRFFLKPKYPSPKWRRSAIEEIIRHHHMGLKLEWLEPDQGYIVRTEYIREFEDLKFYFDNKPAEDLFPQLRVYSSVDRSIIGDPETALWLMRKGVLGPQNVKRVSNSTSNLGYHVDKEGSMVGWCSWDENRNWQVFKKGDKIFNLEYIRVRPDEKWNQAGEFVIKDMHSAKKSAVNFIKYLETF